MEESLTDSLNPQFVTVLADNDRHARWVARICNHDTGYKDVELLIVLDPEGDVVVASRPWPSTCTWSPPIDGARR